MILDYVDEPTKPCKEDDMSFSYAKYGMFSISRKTDYFDCDTPFYSGPQPMTDWTKAQVDSELFWRNRAYGIRYVSYISDRNRERAIKLALMF